MARERAKVIWTLGLVALQALAATSCRIKRAGTAGENEPNAAAPESFGSAPNDSNTGKLGYGPSQSAADGGAAGTLASPSGGGAAAAPRAPDSARVRLPSLDTSITVPGRGGPTTMLNSSPATAGTGSMPASGGAPSLFTSNSDNRGLNGAYGATASSTSVRPPTPIASPSSLSTPGMQPYAAPRIPPPTIWPVTPVAPGSSLPPPPPKPPGGAP